MTRSKINIYWFSSSLIPALQENGKFKDAADLVKEYVKDEQLFFKLICDGRHYQQAAYEARNTTNNSGKIISYQT